MHYGSKYFSKNGGITIQTKNSRDQGRIGNRSGFSATDKIQINKMYCSGWLSFPTIYITLKNEEISLRSLHPFEKFTPKIILEICQTLKKIVYRNFIATFRRKNEL